jgi:hypothetical protein
MKRAKFKDVAFKYRMGAGYPGDVNRTHPVDILPSLMDTTNPPTAFGQAVVIDATSHAIRKIIATDDANISLYGITVRPYPFQQAQTNQNFGAVGIGASGLPVSGEVDVMCRGFMIVAVPTGQTPLKGNPVYVWYEASTGSHVQGGFEAQASAGNTIEVLNAYWNSSADANGYAEIAFNI